MKDEHEIAVNPDGEDLPPPTIRGIPPGARRIVLLAALLLIPAMAAGWFLLGIAGVVGVLSGGVIALANFWVLARIVVNLTASDETVGTGPAVVRLLVKFGLLGGGILFLLFVVHVDPAGLLIGLSVVFISIVLASFLEWVL